MRSGAKIGSLQTNFQAFCSYLFHFGHNSLEGWEIIFGKPSPIAEFKGQMAGERFSGRGGGRPAAALYDLAGEVEVCGTHAPGLMTGILPRLHAAGSAELNGPGGRSRWKAHRGTPDRYLV